MEGEATEGGHELQAVTGDWANLMDAQCTDESTRLVIDQYMQLEQKSAGCESVVDALTMASQELLDAQAENDITLKELNAKADRLKENDLKLVSAFIVPLIAKYMYISIEVERKGHSNNS